MNTNPQMLADLRAHQSLCRELLALAEREVQALRQDQPAALSEIHETRKTLLPPLNDSLERIRQHRLCWQNLSAADRAAQPETAFLIRQVQDLIMRVILLDRENEQGMLRRGLIPAREIPAAAQARPHFVSDLYRRHA